MGAPRRLAVRVPDGTLAPVQVLETRDNIAYETTMSATQFRKLVREVNLRRVGTLFINGVRVEDGRTTRVTLELGPEEEGAFEVERVRAEIEAAIARRPRGRFHVIGVGPPLVRALVATPEIGGLGWTVLEAVEADVAAAPPVRAEGHTLDNGLLRAQVAGDGTVSIEAAGMRFDRLLGLEDGGDAGDEYNYAPPPTDVVITEPSEPPVVDVVEAGPLRATLRVRRTYRIPEGLRTDERARARRTVLLPVTTDLSLRAGEPFLRATTTLHNVARDHRLRVRFGVPISAERSHADGAFDVVERTLEAEGGDHEVGMPTFPCRRWVDVSDGSAGLAVFHRGTPEYELLPGALAITLLRSVGFLSRGGMSTRAGAAGPVLPTPRAQLAGEHTFELALFPHAGDWRAARVHDVAERFAYPLRATALRAHPGSLPAANEPLLLSPASIQLSALHRSGGSTIVRVYNASPEPVDARIAVRAPLRAERAVLVGLLGDERGELSVEPGGVRLALRAWEIATVRLD